MRVSKRNEDVIVPLRGQRTVRPEYKEYGCGCKTGVPKSQRGGRQGVALHCKDLGSGTEQRVSTEPGRKEWGFEKTGRSSRRRVSTSVASRRVLGWVRVE